MIILPATLTHAVAAEFSGDIASLVSSQSNGVVADASALQQFDSSALAVLLACRRETLAVGKVFSVYGLPARLRQLAGLYGVADLVPPTV